MLKNEIQTEGEEKQKTNVSICLTVLPGIRPELHSGR